MKGSVPGHGKCTFLPLSTKQVLVPPEVLTLGNFAKLSKLPDVFLLHRKSGSVFPIAILTTLAAGPYIHISVL